MARLTVATWNVNSIKIRQDGVADWLRHAAPDVVALQEIKCETKSFPTQLFEDLGYNCAVHGQKSYNGVALLSKRPIEDVIITLPGDGDDEQARYIEGVVSLDGQALRIASLYLPNGNPPDSDKYAYKLAWMQRLKAHASALLAHEEILVLAGDYNVIPAEEDVYAPEAWREDALFRLETRRAFREIVHLGFTDALRACDGAPARYTFWDYQGGAWPKNHGIRIDHLLLSPEASDRLLSCVIEKGRRGGEKPSDHVPVMATLRI